VTPIKEKSFSYYPLVFLFDINRIEE